MKTNELKDKIQKLLTYSINLGERSRNLNKLLYQQFYEVIELERLEKLEGKFLQAYLLWKSIMRANYQPNLLSIAPDDQEKLLESIATEVKDIEDNNQKQISRELTDEELMKELRRRFLKGKFLDKDRADYVAFEDKDVVKIQLFFSKEVEEKTPQRKINLKS